MESGLSFRVQSIAFNQMVGIDGSLVADHATLLVSSKNLSFELFAGKEVHFRFLWGDY
jgi:hypothetical protein